MHPHSSPSHVVWIYTTGITTFHDTQGSPCLWNRKKPRDRIHSFTSLQSPWPEGSVHQQDTAETSKLRPQFRRASCWPTCQPSPIVFPDLLQPVGTHIKMPGTFLSAAEGREQRVIFCCVPAHLHPPHTPYRWGLGGCDKAGGCLMWQSWLLPVSKSLQKDSQGRGLFLLWRRRQQRDISRVSSHLTVW